MLKPLKLSIRNWDVIDLETVRGSSNFRKAATGMEAGTGDGEREKLKFFPIRKLQVMNCEALSIFLLDFGSRLENSRESTVESRERDTCDQKGVCGKARLAAYRSEEFRGTSYRLEL